MGEAFASVRYWLFPQARTMGIQVGSRLRNVKSRPNRTGLDGHEPPVGGACRGHHRQGQPYADRGEQQRPAAEAVGKANDRKRAERSQAHDGEPDAQVGARQPGLGDESPAIVRLAEPPGHVAEGRHDAELPEPRGEGGDSRADDGPVAPAMSMMASSGWTASRCSY